MGNEDHQDLAGRDHELAPEVESYQTLLQQLQAERAQRESLEARLAELQSAQQQLERYATDLQQTYAALRRNLHHMTVLHDLSRTIGSALDPDEVISRALDALAQVVAYHTVVIYLLDEQQRQARRTAGRGSAGAQAPERVPLGEGLIGQALSDGVLRSEVVRDDNTGEPMLAQAVPLRAHGRTIGTIYLLRGGSEEFPEGELRILELLAAGTAVAIQNALLYRATQWLATIDPLTEVPNYRYFREALTMEIERARRFHYSLGLLMLDLDHFKRINDAFGHPAGDQVLVRVARVMRSELRRTDVVARLGGEEFAMILPGCARPEVAAVGEKIRFAVAAIPPLIAAGKRKTEITLSVGGTALGPDEVELDLLISQADQALYRAKQAGRNRVRVWGDEKGDDTPKTRKRRSLVATSRSGVKGRGQE